MGFDRKAGCLDEPALVIRFTNSRLDVEWALSVAQQALVGDESNNPTFARRPVERADWSLFRTLEGLQQRAGYRWTSSPGLS